MFSYQRSLYQPTELMTARRFRELITAPRTLDLVRKGREALARGDKAAYDKGKKSLPFVLFIATYDESVKVSVNKRTGKETTRRGAWRNQKYCRLNGLCVIDFDHVDEKPLSPAPSSEDEPLAEDETLAEGEAKTRSIREIWEEACGRLSAEDKARVLLVYVTPSGHGLKVVFEADPDVGNLIDNQRVFSQKLGLNPDEACKDASRGAFLTTENDILFINEEKLFTYENEEFGKKFNEEYHAGHSQPTTDVAKGRADSGDMAAVQAAGGNQQAVSAGHGDDAEGAGSLTYHGVPYQRIVEAWIGDKPVEQGDRHRTSLVLADHLRYITDNDPKLIERILRATPFVRSIVEERNEDVAQTVRSAQGYEFLKGIPRRMQNALKAAGAAEEAPSEPSARGQDEDDIYASLPMDKWAEELQELQGSYPCMRELFLNVHPHKLPAVLFSSAALFGTLMTRTWYHYWFEPEIVRRLNYCVFIIGDPGAGKNVIETIYKKIADPMIQADRCPIDAVNRYKEGRTERSTSTKAQKDEALKRPEAGIRVHPARTAIGEFIRHMHSSVETVEGRELNLHMFSFDAELDNVTKQNKGGDWKDREIMELKAFHNEQDGQMYGNQESYTGMFNIYWNFIYTGTPYALHRRVNQRNFGTGMSTRLAVIPLPDLGMAARHQQVLPNANETLRTWAYRLDKVEGELPVEPLNDETYDWQASHVEIADFNNDRADRMLLKRVPYYGIGISLPFILMRHWDEWQQAKTLTMDDTDKRLCRLAMEIQYRCQQFFFGEMAYNYFADQKKEFVVKKRTTRYSECFRKLPDDFRTKHFQDIFGISRSSASKAIARLRADGLIEEVKYSYYRKVVSELP